MQEVKKYTLYSCLLLLTLFTGACSVNPVTGKSEVRLVSTQQEIDMGEKNYAPMQQTQGGVYQVDPDLSRYVNSVGQQLATKSDRKLPYEFVVLNNSVPNAWALPGGKIAINRGLLAELNNEAELAAVLGHEIVHAAARHSAKKIESGMALNIGLIVLGEAVKDEKSGDLLMQTGAIGAALLTTKYSRDAESEADHFGMKYMVNAGYDPYAAVSLQETFVRLSEGNEQNWLEGLFASHPPSQERVQANRKLAKSLYHSDLVKNEKVFQQKIAHLKKTLPAYNKETKAYNAIKNKDYNAAMKLADEAIVIEGREALFYALKGDVYKIQKEYTAAIKEYSKALTQDDEFFYYFLQRGLSYKEQGNKLKAQQDLQRSYKLLPTRQAYDALQAL